MTTDKIYTTLAAIKGVNEYEYAKLKRSLGGVKAYGKDTPLTFRQIYESDRKELTYDITLQCLDCVVQDDYWNLIRHFACDMIHGINHILDDELKGYADKTRDFLDGKIPEMTFSNYMRKVYIMTEDLLQKDEYIFVKHPAFALFEAMRGYPFRAANCVRMVLMHDGSYKHKGLIKEKQINHLLKYCETGERQYGFTLKDEP